MLLRSNFSSFPHYFIYIFLTSGVKLHIRLLNVVVQFIVFLTLSTLICRGTDISKCYSESLGFRDNESRLYFLISPQNYNMCIHIRSASQSRPLLISTHNICLGEELGKKKKNIYGQTSVKQARLVKPNSDCLIQVDSHIFAFQGI